MSCKEKAYIIFIASNSDKIFLGREGSYLKDVKLREKIKEGDEYIIASRIPELPRLFYESIETNISKISAEYRNITNYSRSNPIKFNFRNTIDDISKWDDVTRTSQPDGRGRHGVFFVDKKFNKQQGLATLPICDLSTVKGDIEDTDRHSNPEDPGKGCVIRESREEIKLILDNTKINKIGVITEPCVEHIYTYKLSEAEMEQINNLDRDDILSDLKFVKWIDVLDLHKYESEFASRTRSVLFYYVNLYRNSRDHTQALETVSSHLEKYDNRSTKKVRLDNRFNVTGSASFPFPSGESFGLSFPEPATSAAYPPTGSASATSAAYPPTGSASAASAAYPPTGSASTVYQQHPEEAISDKKRKPQIILYIYGDWYLYQSNSTKYHYWYNIKTKKSEYKNPGLPPEIDAERRRRDIEVRLSSGLHGGFINKYNIQKNKCLTIKNKFID